MGNTTSHNKQAEVGKGEWLKKRIIPLLTLLLVVAITVGLLLFARSYPEMVEEFGTYGYLGAFLISLIGNAGVILAAPVLPMLAAIAVILYPVTGVVGPVIVGLVAGAGAGIGEMVGYALGCSGRDVLGNNKMYLRLVGWMRRWGAMAIFILSVVPFFFDVVGIAAGALRFPLWKFVLACWLGRTVLYVVTVVTVALGWGIVLRYLG